MLSRIQLLLGLMQKYPDFDSAIREGIALTKQKHSAETAFNRAHYISIKIADAIDDEFFKGNLTGIEWSTAIYFNDLIFRKIRGSYFE